MLDIASMNVAKCGYIFRRPDVIFDDNPDSRISKVLEAEHNRFFSVLDVCSNFLNKCCWNGRFGEETDHLVLNEMGGDLVLEAVYEAQAKLNLLDEKIFPLLPLQCNGPSTVSVLVHYVYIL